MPAHRIGTGARLTRRAMLRDTALAGFGIWTLSRHAGGAQIPSPNERLSIACIGVGGRGAHNLADCSGEQIVALCDVDQRRAAAAGQKFPQARHYRDFRKMLDEMDREIDAVVVSTPDHIHAPAAVLAMKMGKHCYCEKPLAHTVAEVRMMTELARRKGLATQMGTQIHAGANYRRVVELVQSGAIGPVAEVHVWHPVRYEGGGRPTDTPPAPAELDWDLWLGPAPVRPYHPCYVPGAWRGWWDFGNGGLGDFGCHYMDLPFWALRLRHPSTIEAEGPRVHPERTSSGLIVRYEFPARDALPAVRMTWYDGGRRPDFLSDRKIPEWGAAVLFIGSKGMLIADYDRHRLLPEDQFAGFQRPDPTIPDSIGHHAEWIRACKTGAPTTCNFDYSGALAETVLLGNAAHRVGKKLRWDPARLEAAGCPEADAFLHKAYRKGWEL
ncbi:MAG TPA: Gfo/Idh/MocA family oxidoreductase [Candidatus Paceibacterota bacterium]|nr:Gfo/Idh/MocA family oxidoreductase [Verrucomicrobiota bacterium]HRZ47610.1 Gfo/Idh/MocA family oxidoreductase [Candidatus Paceibacterota bacterium]